MATPGYSQPGILGFFRMSLGDVEKCHEIRYTHTHTPWTVQDLKSLKILHVLMFVPICFRPDSSRVFEARWVQKVSNVFQYESEKLRQHDGEAANHHLKSSRTLMSSPGWDIHHLESWQISVQNKMPAQKLHVKLPIKFVVSNLHLIKKSVRHSSVNPWTQTNVPHDPSFHHNRNKIPYIFGQCIQMLLNRLIFGAQLLALSGRSLGVF